VAHREDAAVDHVEVAGFDAALDFVACVTELQKLPARDDALLAIRQLGDHNVT
jgi:hypothetical protein